MRLITTNEQLTALLPNIAVTVQGEVPLFEKLSPFLAATEKWLIEEFTSDRTFNTICGYVDDNPTKVLATQIVAYEAFRRALPHLDVILTPNGFGIVSNTNIAPASKERINRLLDTLLENRDAALLNFIPLLYVASQWNKSEQCKFFAATMFPNIDVVKHFPRQDGGQWEQYLAIRLQLIPLEEHIATQYMSAPLMETLRSQVQSRQYSTEKHRYICRVLRAVEVDCLKESNHSAAMQKAHRTLTQLVELVRSNPEDFPEWHESDTAQLYNPPIFENKKNSQGFWF